MPKQIKVSDEIYDRLKADADKNYRSMGGQIEFLMDSHSGMSPEAVIRSKPDVSDLVRPDMPKKSEPTARDTRDTRTKGDILADIRETEAQRDEELRYCQDADTVKKITDRYAGAIDLLWREFNLIKE